MVFFTSNAKVIIITTLAVVLLMTVAFLIVFSITLKGGDEVMVPQLEGRAIVDALIEMQEKELYPRIQLSYSSDSAETGRVLEQEPKAGSIVKAGRRISLVVSRGSSTDQVDNFTGQNIDNVRKSLQALAASGNGPTLSIMEPVMYRESAEPAGTILEQSPAPGTVITEPIQVSFVVSSGVDSTLVSVPLLEGKAIAELISIMQDAELSFSFRATSQGGAEAGTVISQSPQARTQAPKFSAVDSVIAMPPASRSGYVYGIFSEELPRYREPFQVTVDIVSPSGRRQRYLSMQHMGGIFSFPYALDEGSMISLTVRDREYGTYDISPAISSSPEESSYVEEREEQEEYSLDYFDNLF